MAFVDLAAELAGTLPGLSPILANTYVNRAWTDIQRVRRWSFNSDVDGAVVCPAQLTAGTVSFVQYTLSVTLSAAASAALLPFTVVGSVPLATQLQIRFGGSSILAGNQIYRIMAVDVSVPAALVLTLDRIIVEPTTVASTYQIYRCYVTPPAANFLAWTSFVDTLSGYPLKLNWTSAAIDATDPQRSSQGDAYVVAFYRAAGPLDPNVNSGSPIYELWPHPTSGRTYYVRYASRIAPFTLPTDTQPDQISDTLLITRAQGWHAYPFAMANTGNFPTMKGVNWTVLLAAAKQDYFGELRTAKKNDDSTALQNVYNRGHGLRDRGLGGATFPIDAAYIQSHLLPF